MKKKHPEHVNLERWLVSYADFITLLFAFFVIMYAMSQADVQKFKKVSVSLRSAFSSGAIDLGASSGGPTSNPFESLEPKGGRVLDMPAGKVNTASSPDPQLQEVKELIEETISLELGTSDLSEKLQMTYDSRGLVIRLSARDLYDFGEVEITPDLRPIVDRIGKILRSTHRIFRIEGHTDVAEAKVASYPSDWELSTARAAWAARYIMKRHDLDPTRVGVAGYSHYRPIAGPSHASSNRRLEFIILNNSYETP